MIREIKCVIWDLDDTLWEGTLAEDEDVVLRPGMREIIVGLDRRGVLQSIASRNDCTDAMRKLTEFGLAEYFLFPEVNWGAKSRSVERILRNLNIGADAVLFIDDQVCERDEVRSVHEGIGCIGADAWGSLLDYPGLSGGPITIDTRRRRLMYLEDIQRRKDEESFDGPKESFLYSLNMELSIAEAQDDDLDRAVELTRRTNQLNATGRTYSYEELKQFSLSDTHRLLICELRDRYGSYGKIGLALIELHDQYWHLQLLLTSCRVISRGIGAVLLSFIMQEAKRQGKSLRVDFRHTGRNRMMYVALKFLNFREVTEGHHSGVLFEHDLSESPCLPAYIDIVVR